MNSYAPKSEEERAAALTRQSVHNDRARRTPTRANVHEVAEPAVDEAANHSPSKPFPFESLPWKIQSRIIKLLVVTDVRIDIDDYHPFHPLVKQPSDSDGFYNLAIARTNWRLYRDCMRYFWAESKFIIKLSHPNCQRKVSNNEANVTMFLRGGHKYMDSTVFLKDPSTTSTEDLPRVTEVSDRVLFSSVTRGALMQHVSFFGLPPLDVKKFCDWHDAPQPDWASQFRMLRVIQEERMRITPVWDNQQNSPHATGAMPGEFWNRDVGHIPQALDTLFSLQFGGQVMPQLEGLFRTNTGHLARTGGLDEVGLSFGTSLVCYRHNTRRQFFSHNDRQEIQRLLRNWPAHPLEQGDPIKKLTLSCLTEGERGYRFLQLAMLLLTNPSVPTSIEITDSESNQLIVVNGQLVRQNTPPSICIAGWDKLSKEIKMHILSFLLIAPTCIQDGSANTGSMKCEEYRGLDCEPAHIAVLRTSKDLHQLGTRVLYEQNAFKFSSARFYDPFINQEVTDYLSITEGTRTTYKKVSVQRKTLVKEIILEDSLWKEKIDWRRYGPLCVPTPALRLWDSIKATTRNLRKFTLRFEGQDYSVLQDMMDFLASGLVHLGRENRSIRWTCSQREGETTTRWTAKIPRIEWEWMSAMKVVLEGQRASQSATYEALEELLRDACSYVGLGFEVEYDQSVMPVVEEESEEEEGEGEPVDGEEDEGDVAEEDEEENLDDDMEDDQEDNEEDEEEEYDEDEEEGDPSGMAGNDDHA